MPKQEIHKPLLSEANWKNVCSFSQKILPTDLPVITFSKWSVSPIAVYTDSQAEVKVVIPTAQMSRLRLVCTAQQRQSRGASLGCRRPPLPSDSDSWAKTPSPLHNSTSKLPNCFQYSLEGVLFSHIKKIILKFLSPWGAWKGCM